jgi:hypothetical protein
MRSLWTPSLLGPPRIAVVARTARARSDTNGPALRKKCGGGHLPPVILGGPEGDSAGSRTAEAVLGAGGGVFQRVKTPDPPPGGLGRRGRRRRPGRFSAAPLSPATVPELFLRKPPGAQNDGGPRR